MDGATLDGAVSEEIPLGGGALTDGVVRLGDTVRRPSSPATSRVRDVLLHLERAGFDAAPRWLGVEDQDREMLSWIEGDTFPERGRMHPYIGDPPNPSFSRTSRSRPRCDCCVATTTASRTQ